MRREGISRRKRRISRKGKKSIAWDYFDPRGKRIVKSAVIDRCNKLVLPPAWEHVWISLDPESHLQATGMDGRGRLQYRYHAKWTQARAAEKFDSMAEFAAVLPQIRRAVRHDLRLAGMPRAKVVALIVALIDRYHFRVGNDEYARTNNSYGLTTLTKGHMVVDKSRSAEGRLDAVFEFVGKSGKLWKRRIWEDDLAQLIEKTGQLGGRKRSHDLFRYEDDRGRVCDIKSSHVNDYLDNITPEDFRVTAKDFRTWAATCKTAARLSKQLDSDTDKARKRVANEVIKTVASDLGNTVAVCRSSYIHPIILSDWTEGAFRSKWNKALKARKIPELSRDEAVTLAYLA